MHVERLSFNFRTTPGDFETPVWPVTEAAALRGLWQTVNSRGRCSFCRPPDRNGGPAWNLRDFIAEPSALHLWVTSPVMRGCYGLHWRKVQGDTQHWTIGMFAAHWYSDNTLRIHPWYHLSPRPQGHAQLQALKLTQVLCMCSYSALRGAMRHSLLITLSMPNKWKSGKE